MGLRAKIIFAIIGVTLVGWLLWLASYWVLPQGAPLPTQNSYNPPTTQPRQGYNLYHSLIFRFTLEYPEVMKVTEYHDGDGTTVVFEDESGEKGFQIFIVPYTEPQISEARFKADVPSGVMQEPTDLTVGGARARAFYSSDLGLGDTREIWFLANGFLYEVTAHKSLDSWLAELMLGWRFI